MTTARDIVTSALRKLGALRVGESPTAGEASDALEIMNDLLESHSNDGLMVYARTLENFALSGGVSDYTIGPSATFDTTRPVYIVDAYYRSGDIDYPIRVVQDQDYADISIKTTQAYPYWLNYTNGFPIATIKLYPTPDASGLLFLLSEKPLQTFTIDQDVSLPPGWLRYLKNQLVIELAPEYGLEVPQSAAVTAKSALAAIKRGVARTRTMDNKSYAGTRQNIYTGWEY